MGPVGDITQILAKLKDGDSSSEAELVQVVYAELRKIAVGQLRRERGDHTLQPTALVHETYLRLLGAHRSAWHNREHFFRAAARAMRHILVDYARAAKAERRGGDHQTRVELSDLSGFVESKADEILAVEQVLDRLEARSPRQKTIVEMKFFGGLTDEEIASILDISVRTVKRDWSVARAWLHGEIYGSERSTAAPSAP
jgi:RNA polymerase sigma factor (TIGR02999 family)